MLRSTTIDVDAIPQPREGAETRYDWVAPRLHRMIAGDAEVGTLPASEGPMLGS